MEARIKAAAIMKVAATKMATGTHGAARMTVAYNNK
jgi:hypothetical protein